jgi:sulfur-carrier protein adenylyltransferase/sulfurtransferase
MNGSSGRLSPTSLIRNREYYLRQMRLPGVGEAGQLRLQNAGAVVVGMGALGCPVVTYLARAGIGAITLIDGDTVDVTNLHRQTLYGRSDVGRLKVDVVADHLRREFPHIRLDVRPEYLDAASVDFVAAGNTEVVLDCTDRFSSRFALHDRALTKRLNLVSAAVSSTTGQLYVLPFARSPGPCLRCLYPQEPPDGCTGSCSDDGILGASAGVMGSLQALTALRLILGLPGPAESAVHTIDLTSLEVTSAGWDPDPDCPVCGGETGGDAGGGAAIEVKPGLHMEPDIEGYTERETATETETGPDGGDIMVVDVREEEPAENGAGRDSRGPGDAGAVFFPGARRIPAGEFRGIMDGMDRDGSYLLVCEHGILSRTIRDEMVRKGFRHVADIAGGYAALKGRIRQT